MDGGNPSVINSYLESSCGLSKKLEKLLYSVCIREVRSVAHDVFISYASEDKTVADAVCASLEAHSVRCWIAPRDVLPGVAYGEAIIDAIQGSHIMVLVFSSKSNISPHIPREVERAVSRGTPIMPFRIEDVMPGKTLDYFIGNVHWLDALTPPLERHLDRLAQNITTLLSRDAPLIERKRAPEYVTVGRSQSRRTSFLITLCAIATILVMVFAGLYFSRKQTATGDGILSSKALYSSAIEKLALQDPQARMLGIRQLEVVAESDESYRPRVRQVLVDFVKQRALWKEDVALERDSARGPDEDVQAAMHVIGRWPQKVGPNADRLNLRYTDLRGAELSSLHFELSFFSSAHLEHAFLRQGYFEGVVCAGTHMEGAFLDDTHFEGADLEGVFFERAKLNGAHLEGATLGPRPDADPQHQYADAVGLTCDQLKSAHVDKSTVLPTYLRGKNCLEKLSSK